MNELMLCRALRELIAKATSGIQMPDEKGIMRPVTVVDGYLPRRADDIPDPFPFVIVRPKEVSAVEELTTGTIELIVGCRYTGEDDFGDVTQPMNGYADCLNIVHRIRQALMNLPNRVLDKRYELTLPVKWVVHDDATFPFWQVDVTTTWEWFSPVALETLNSETFG